MTNEYWFKQTESPLFPELHWSRPENKKHAGKLAILGGHAQSFATSATAFNEAEKAGIGTTRVLLPDSLQKMVSKLFPEAEFTPSTPSGSFGHESLAAFLEVGQWADGILLAGDTGHNSETVSFLEYFAEAQTGRLILTGDSADALLRLGQSRDDTLFVLTFNQLQKFVQMLKSTQAVTTSMGILAMVNLLHDLTLINKPHIITIYDEHIFVAVGGKVSTTKSSSMTANQQSRVAAFASVWWLQNTQKPFESISTGVFDSR